MIALPQGWAITKVGELIELQYGKALPDRERSGEGYPVYGSNGVVGQHSSARTKGPTIIVGRKGSVGVVAFSAGPCNPIDTTYFVEKVPGGQMRFWFHVLRSMRLGELNKSTAIPGLSRTDVGPIRMALPPEREQQRIADKLDTVLARVDACRDRLARIAPLLKRFRQSVLAAATSGLLTDDWRAASQGLQVTAWVGASVGAVALDVRYGTSKRCDYGSGGVGVLRIPNVGTDGQIDVRDLKRAAFTSSEIATLGLISGDLLVIRSNGSVDLVGKTAVVSSAETGLLFAGYLMRIRVDARKALPRFVMHCLSAPKQRALIERTSKSTSGVNNLNAQELRALPMSLPSLAEQAEIVRRVESLFAYADRLEARLATARTAVDRLTPALLAKAFRGELVPQDPNDEPAAELLRRLAESRQTALPKPRRRQPA